MASDAADTKPGQEPEEQKSQQDQQRQSEPWDVAQNEAALAHLEKLQEQLDNLRSAIPALVSPLQHTNQPSKTQVFAGIRQAAVQTLDDLNTFKTDWNSETTGEILARARESRQKNGDFARTGEMESYGWRKE